MKLTFLGTRGYIKPRTERHYMMASLLVSYRHTRIIIDRGEDWIGNDNWYGAHAVLLTHAHPDHAWGLKAGAPCPVYASEDTWERMGSFQIEKRHTAGIRVPVTVGDMTFEAFGVEHSTRAPAVGYRVTCGRHSFFYAPDLVFIYDRGEAMACAEMYIGDGSTVDISFVRTRQGALIGHSPIRTELTWCHKEGVPLMIVTHCGAQIVGAEDEQVLIDRIDAFAAEREVKAAVAFDGMELLLR